MTVVWGKYMSILASQFYTQSCKHASATWTHARLTRHPPPHVAQPRRKTPIPTDQKEKQSFWIKVLWSPLGPCVFLVIIIYSRHVDNAPTQTQQGIIHFVCGDVAVPQIVQTTGQSPEPHNSMSKGRGEEGWVLHQALILRISLRGTKCILMAWQLRTEGAQDIWIYSL